MTEKHWKNSELHGGTAVGVGMEMGIPDLDLASKMIIWHVGPKGRDGEGLLQVEMSSMSQDTKLGF